MDCHAVCLQWNSPTTVLAMLGITFKGGDAVQWQRQSTEND